MQELQMDYNLLLSPKQAFQEDHLSERWGSNKYITVCQESAS
jgi:hypothetical protein